MLHLRHAAGLPRMKIGRIIKMIAALGGLGALGIALAGFATPVPRHPGPAGTHFDGEEFFNTPPFEKDFGDFLHWQLDRDRGRWETDLAPFPGDPPPASVPGDMVRVTWVNHATVLIQAGPVNILTDPVWSERASPFSWAGPARHLAPGVAFGDLPAIDVVLVSHNHFDHMDLQTLQRLAERDDPVFLVPLANCVYLREFADGRCREFDWWQSTELPGSVRVTAVPARHWSRRGLLDTNRALWAGWVVEGARRIYFAGDTGAGWHFREIRERLGAPDLAILPIGAYLPRWFMGDQHLSPGDAVEAAASLEAGQTMVMHHATFELADDGQWEALETLRGILDGKPGAAFWMPSHGDAREWSGESRVASR